MYSKQMLYFHYHYSLPPYRDKNLHPECGPHVFALRFISAALWKKCTHIPRQGIYRESGSDAHSSEREANLVRSFALSNRRNRSFSSEPRQYTRYHSNWWMGPTFGSCYSRQKDSLEVIFVCRCRMWRGCKTTQMFVFLMPPSPYSSCLLCGCRVFSFLPLTNGCLFVCRTGNSIHLDRRSFVYHFILETLLFRWSTDTETKRIRHSLSCQPAITFPSKVKPTIASRRARFSPSILSNSPKRGNEAQPPKSANLYVGMPATRRTTKQKQRSCSGWKKWSKSHRNDLN